MHWMNTHWLLVSSRTSVVDNDHCFGSTSSHDLGPKVRFFLHRPFKFIHRVNIEIADVTLSFSLNTSLDICITFESNNLLLESFDRLIQISICQFKPLGVRVLFILFVQQNLGFFKHIYLVQNIFFKSPYFGTCLNINFYNVFWIVRLKACRSFFILILFLFYFFMLFILPFIRFFFFFTIHIHHFLSSLFFLFIRINLLFCLTLCLFSLIIGLHIDVFLCRNRLFFIQDIFSFNQITRSKVQLNELHFYLLDNFWLSHGRRLSTVYPSFLSFQRSLFPARTFRLGFHIFHTRWWLFNTNRSILIHSWNIYVFLTSPISHWSVSLHILREWFLVIYQFRVSHSNVGN